MKNRFISNLAFLFLFFICQNLIAQGKYFKMPSNYTVDDYIANTIIFKVKPEFRSSCQEKSVNGLKANSILSAISAYNIHTIFPGKTPPTARLNKYGEKLVDLSLIYECKYSSSTTLESAINQLYASGMFEYVQPHYLPHLLFVPDDPCADTTNVSFVQWHLKTIHAYEAWSIQQGNPDIVIGIVDTGTNLLDSDLVHNIKINYADPIDGIDNDNDGYIDNYYGYDLADNNFSPQWNYYPNVCSTCNIGHGVFVSGLAAAKTNNDTGGAGVGFNCQYLPVKICDTNGILTMAYEGIVYAAEHGCSVINCSWGSESTDGPYGQDIVNYATNNMNSLVVAACGNANNDYSWYPASYDNVLSVAATDIYDHKWIDPTGTGSSYGIYVDISAPGYEVYSNWVDGSITHSSGTSCAAPIVCGAAAIVKANNPSLSPIQIGEQLKVTADNIDTIPANFPFAGLLGTGRLNMYKALTVTNLPSIIMTSNSMIDKNNMSFEGGDTIMISGEFRNYLDTSSSALKVTLSTMSPYATVLDSISVLGVINTLDSTNNNSSPFKVVLSTSIPISTEVDFKLTYNDPTTGYKANQYFSIIVNVDYFNIDTNKVATTFTSKGMIGYNIPVNYAQGIGLTYNNKPSLLNDGGFLVGASTAKVSDDIYGQDSGSFDTDFKTLKSAHRIIPPVVSDFDAITEFSDSLAVSPLGILVTNKAYAWASVPKDKFIILEYTIKNISTSSLSSLYAGLFMDFDISSNGAYDQIDFDATNKMGYTYSTQGGTYAGIKLLSSGPLHHFAFDNDGIQYAPFKPTSIDINDGFTSVEKYTALSTSTNRNEAGFGSPNGNNVSDMLSSGPFMLPIGDSVIVTFALIAGDNLADIQASAIEADKLYNHTGINEYTLNNSNLYSVYPVPATDNLQIETNSAVRGEYAELKIYDVVGNLVFEKSITTNKTTLDVSTLPSGVYVVQVKTEKGIEVKKFIKE